MSGNIGNIHKALLSVVLILLAAEIVVYIYVLRPHQFEVSKEKSSLKSSIADLRRNNWPANVSVLNSIKNEYKAKLDGDDEDEKSISMLYDLVMKRAGASFLSRIEKDYSGLHEFRRNASRLDYQAEHNRVFSDMAKRGFVLDPIAVGLDENAPSPYIYQLMLQLWTMETLLNLAADAGLSLQPQEASVHVPRGRKSQHATEPVQQSSVCVLPMRAYMIKSRPTPYLAEFPVSLRLRGSLSSMLDFLGKVQGNELFLPVSSFEIFAMPPDKASASSRGAPPSGTMHFNLVCSSFLPLPK